MKLALNNDTPYPCMARVLVDGEEVGYVQSLHILLDAEYGYQKLIVKRLVDDQFVADWLDITGLSISLETKEG